MLGVSTVFNEGKDMQINFICHLIDDFLKSPSEGLNGYFTLLGVWKMEFQYKFERNQHFYN
jgi:hypothetical protein